MRKLFKKYKEIMLFMLIYWFICFLVFFQDISFLYIILSWNVLLAILPLFFIYKSEKNIKKGKPAHSVFWMVLWLLFFPNSVYMVTDFIHISGDELMRTIDAGRYSWNRQIVYSNNILIWIKLLVIGVGFLFSILVGLESLYIFEQNIKTMSSKNLSFLGVLLATLLSATGVYIGRFLRFNSWDIFLKPIRLIKGLTTAVNVFTAQFIIVFAIFIIVCYTLYRIFRRTVFKGI